MGLVKFQVPNPQRVKWSYGNENESRCSSVYGLG